MPEQMTRTVQVQAGGRSYNARETLTSDNLAGGSPTLAAAKTGTLSARTDANTGTLTLQSGHGVLTGDKIDVFWTDGCRYGMTVGTVSGTSVPIDLGAGDDLPAATTAVTAMVPQVENAAATGNDVVGMFAACTKPAVVKFLDGSNAVLHAAVIKDAAGGVENWITGDRAANPLDSVTVAKIAYSHGDSSASRTVTGRLFYN